MGDDDEHHNTVHIDKPVCSLNGASYTHKPIEHAVIIHEPKQPLGEL